MARSSGRPGRSGDWFLVILSPLVEYLGAFVGCMDAFMRGCVHGLAIGTLHKHVVSTCQHDLEEK